MRATELPSAWDEAFAQAAGEWARRQRGGTLQATTVGRYEQILRTFVRYVSAHGVRAPREVTPSLCLRYCSAPSRDIQRVSSSTSRIRLTVVRSAMGTWVEGGLLELNPADTLVIPYQSIARVLSAVTPSEATRVLGAGRQDPWDTLRPASAALALAGLSNREIAAATVEDLCLQSRRIRVARAGRAVVSIPLSRDASSALAARVQSQRLAYRRRAEAWRASDAPLALMRPASSYPTNSLAPIVTQNLQLALASSGVARAGIRPASLRAFAANAMYARTERVEDVAELLGISSLDSAARLIDHAWQTKWAERVRGASETT